MAALAIGGRHVDSITVTERYIHSSEEAKRKAVELLAGKSAKEAENGDSLLRVGDMKEPAFWPRFRYCCLNLTSLQTVFYHRPGWMREN